MEFVIDTSAILAVIAEQPEKDDLVRITRGATLMAPPSVNWEIGNALSAMFERRKIVLDQALRLLDAYAEIPIRVIDIDLKQAIELSSQHGIYAYDAYILACAVNQRAPLLTLDQGLASCARTMKLEVPQITSL